MGLIGRINSVVLREISEANIKILGDIVAAEDFSLDLIEESATAGRNMFLWIRKADAYLQSFQSCKDTVLKLERLQQRRADCETEIGLMANDLNKLQTTVDKQRQKETNAQEVVDQAKEELYQCTKRASRCKLLVQHLTLHFSIWEQAFAKFEDKSTIVSGNSILAAASLEYLSILDQDTRRSMKQRWQKILSSNGVKFSTNFRLEKFVGSREELYNWRLAGLPESSLNLENALVLKMNTRPKLVFDPNDTCIQWLKKYGETSKRTVSITSAKDKDQAIKVQGCLEKGGTLIIDFFDGAVVGLVASLLDQVVRETEGQKTIKIEDMWYNFDEGFDFILLTRDAKVIYLADMQKKCCIVNFALDSQGLQQSISSMLSSVFEPELEEAHLAALQSQLEKRAFLANNQDKILKKLILNTDEQLLEEEDYLKMLEKFSEAASQLGKETQNQAVVEENQKSYQNYLLTLLVDCYLLLNRFAEWERLLKLSANYYLRIAHRCILSCGVSVKDDLNKNIILDIIRDVFNSVSSGVSKEIRLFMLVDLCVITLKMFGQFRQDLWNYIINANTNTKKSTKDDLDLDLGDSLWKKLQNLRSMIPDIEMEHLPALIQTFKSASQVGVEKAMHDALSKTVELSSLERLAMYVSFVPENFNLCLELFAEDVLPGSRWKTTSFTDRLKMTSHDQPLIYLPVVSCDYAALTIEIRDKLGAAPQIIYCAASTLPKVLAVLNRAVFDGIPVIMTEFHLNPNLHEPVCRFLRELKERDYVESAFRLALILPQDFREIPVELSDMAVKLLELNDENTDDSLVSIFGKVKTTAFSGSTLKLQNTAINAMLAFHSLRTRSIFGDHAFLGKVTLSELDLQALASFLNEMGRMKLPLDAADLPVVEQTMLTMFFGCIDNPVDSAVVCWFWHQAFIQDQKNALTLR